MTVSDAAKILELPLDSSPEQIETRFLEMRRKLEDKIAKAPTPGLQSKYRNALNEVTEAFETMTLAADASSLPVLQRDDAAARGQVGDAASAKSDSSAGADARPASPPPIAPASRADRRKPKAKSYEFLVVTVIAIAVFAAGGWWIVNMRQEKAEKARLAAIAEAEALRKKQEEEAKAAELVRIGNDARAKLAEARVAWEALESELRDAERRTSELKSELRGFRDGPATKKAELSSLAARQELFTEWMKASLIRHPAKISRARAEQALESRESVEALEWAKDFDLKLQELTDQIAEQRTYLFNTTATLRVESKPAGVKFVYTDAYGRTTEGVTPAQIKDTPLTHVFEPVVAGQALAGELVGDSSTSKMGEFTREKAEVVFMRPGWSQRTAGTTVASDAPQTLSVEYDEGALHVESLPSGVPFRVTNSLGFNVTGTAPATVKPVPPGSLTVTLSRTGYRDVTSNVTVNKGATAKVSLDQRPQHIVIAPSPAETEVWVDGKFIGKGQQTLTAHAPGEHQLEIRHPSYSRYRDKFTVKQEWTKQTLRYDFAQLARRDIACSSCTGKGYHTRWLNCRTCGADGWRRCGGCNGAGKVPFLQGQITCFGCSGNGSVSCEDCGQTGKIRQDDTCTRCNGQAYFSKLELNK